MNLSEFKAWFEGFTESMDGPPGEKQWKRIRERVKEIRADPTPPHIVREYIRDYRDWVYPRWATFNGATPLAATVGGGTLDATVSDLMAQACSPAAQGQRAFAAAADFHHQAFGALGRADAAKLG